MDRDYSKIVAVPPAKINHSIMHDVVILMTPNEQEALKQMIAAAPDDAVFVEYGCGGSTCLFAAHMRASQKLYSIEHQKEWFERIRMVLGDMQRGGEVFLFWKPAAGGRKMGFQLGEDVHIIEEHEFRRYGTPTEELPHGLEDYINATGIDIDWSKVHCVLVDGVARGAVLAMIRHKLSPDAMVIVLDAAQRNIWYTWAVQPLYDAHGFVDSMLWLTVPKK